MDVMFIQQIVCSFLVRDMGLDWRMGAEWFETCLLDYDPCSNYGNWTYGAGDTYFYASSSEHHLCFLHGFQLYHGITLACSSVFLLKVLYLTSHITFRGEMEKILISHSSVMIYDLYSIL